MISKGPFKQKLLKQFNSFKKLLKSLTFAKVARLFNSKKKGYESLISRMDSFAGILEATAAGGSTTYEIGDEIEEIKKSTKGRYRPNKVLRSQKTLKDGSSMKLDSFRVPNRKKLAENTKILAEAELALDELETFLGVMHGKTTVAGKKLVAEAKNYYEVINEKADTISEVLKELSTKHEPKVMREIREAAWDFIARKLPAGTYGEPSNDLYITSHDAIAGNDDANIQFTAYIYLPMLDLDMYKNGDLTIILTGVVGLKPRTKFYNIELYVTSLNTTDPRKMVPGSFDVGEKMTGTDVNNLIRSMNKEIDTLIALNRMKPELAAIKFGRNVTQQLLRNSKILDVKNVADVDVIEGNKTIKVLLDADVSDRQAENIFYKVLPVLNSMREVSGRSRGKFRNSFVYTIDEDEDGTYLAIKKVKELG